ncbi:MAG: hypothetical protein JWN85_1888 [Gammaproteobacteria bacterium]|nr:hypothetical protein [Gammaproteobacteria bacterium]
MGTMSYEVTSEQHGLTVLVAALLLASALPLPAQTSPAAPATPIEPAPLRRSSCWHRQQTAGQAHFRGHVEQGRRRLLGNPAGKKGDSAWLFSTTGTAGVFPHFGPPPRCRPPEIKVTFAPGAPELGAGKQVFHTCGVACHGDTGLGSHGGAALVNASKDAKFVITTATTGRNDMPSFKGVLTPQPLRDVAGYITTGLFPPP